MNAPGAPVPPTGLAKQQSRNGGQPFTAEAVGQAAAAGVAQALGPVLTQMLPSLVSNLPAMISQAVAQAQQPRLCALCLLARIGWENTHRPAMTAAHEAACQVAGVDPKSPQAQQVDISAFLPARLAPGSGLPEAMPPVHPAVTTHEGTDKCPGHLAPQTGPRLLAVTGPFSPAMLGPVT